jgi:hypothetical protein
VRMQHKPHDRRAERARSWIPCDDRKRHDLPPTPNDPNLS